MSQQIVVFDFDGTMIRRDSTLWLIKELFWVNWLKLPITFAYLVGMFCARSGKPEHLQELKCKCIGNLIKGKTLEGLKASLDRFRNKVLSAQVDQSFARIMEAADRGQRVVVVTASPEIAIAHALKDFPVTVVGTSYIILNGRYTGALLSPPCFGSEKVKRMDAWLSHANLLWEDVVEAWGDSPSDWPLMGKCDKRVWISGSQQKSEVLRVLDPEGQHLMPNVWL